MVAPAIIGAGIGLVGSLLGGSAQKRAAQKAADAQLESARIAAEASKFKPYNVTTGLAKSSFDQQNGTATYELDPRLRQLQGQMFDMGQQAMPQNMDPAAASQGLFDRYQQMLAPSREQQFAQLQNSQFNKGTLGLAVGATSNGLGNANPALQSYLNSIFQQDQQLAMQADDTSRRYLDQDLARTQGLFNYGMGLEQQGLSALDYGINMGGKHASAGAQVGNALLKGGLGAAGTMYESQNKFINDMSKSAVGMWDAYKNYQAPPQQQPVYNFNSGDAGITNSYNGVGPAGVIMDGY